MAEVRKPIPVFLPGSSRDWEQVAGIATITDEGEINIKLHSKTMALELVENWTKDNKIVSCGFDYVKAGL
jgi:hypothetical protein